MSIGAAGLCPAVSCPTWHHYVSLWQETCRKQFPVRLGTIAFHSDRKLFRQQSSSRHDFSVLHLNRKRPLLWNCEEKYRVHISPCLSSPPKGPSFLYWFPSFHWTWTGNGFCFWALFSIFLFFLQDLVQLTFSWQNLFPLFSSPSFLCEKSIHNFSSCG